MSEADSPSLLNSIPLSDSRGTIHGDSLRCMLACFLDSLPALLVPQRTRYHVCRSMRHCLAARNDDYQIDSPPLDRKLFRRFRGPIRHRRIYRLTKNGPHRAIIRILNSGMPRATDAAKRGTILLHSETLERTMGNGSI